MNEQYKTLNAENQIFICQVVKAMTAETPEESSEGLSRRRLIRLMRQTDRYREASTEKISAFIDTLGLVKGVTE